MNIAAVTILLSAAPVFGQTVSKSQTVSPAHGGVARLSSKTPIETLMANPAARAAVLKLFPRIDKNPLYNTLKTSSFLQIALQYPGSFTAKQLAELDAALRALK